MGEVPITRENARAAFDAAARAAPAPASLSGTGIVICAGGPFVPSAYVGVRLLRRFGVTLPIELWHAGKDELPGWSRSALAPWSVHLRDVMPFCPGHTVEQMRGWPIKPAALLHSAFRHVLFLDADCFALRGPEFLFDTAEYRETGALFWPDSRHHKMVPDATIWELTGLHYQDSEFETGIVALDRERCWRELWLTNWMNARADFWYAHVMGDKDTFYLSWRKLRSPFFLAPPCRRYGAVITRHFWTDGRPLADHRTGASKYALPRRRGPVTVHLAPYRWRSDAKNVYDELMQRFLVKGFREHARYLRELGALRDAWAPGDASPEAKGAPLDG